MDEKGNTHICEAPPVLPVEAVPERACPTYLIVLRGGIPGAMLQLTPGESWIGRSGECLIQLADPTVSRLHAVLHVGTDGRADLIDRESTNGTYVNNRRLAPGEPMRLSDGDRLRIGSMVVLKFSQPDPCEEHFQRELFERSVRDHLTGLYNRAYLLDRMTPLAQRSSASGLGLAVLMLDIDHFKGINDTYGHDVGDAVLREVAAVLRQMTRSEDLVARYGGEEFVAVLPCATLDRAVERAERIRARLADRQVRCVEGPLRVTASIGVAFAAAERPRPPGSLISAADLHLYQAKEAGRNRVSSPLNRAAPDSDEFLTKDGESPFCPDLATDQYPPVATSPPALT